MAMRIRSTPRFAGPALVALLFTHIVCGAGRAALRGGCAKVNITPPLGITLIGSKGQPSDAVMDELYAKAMVLSDGGETLALISADLLYAPREEIAGPVRDIVNEKTGIPRQNIMVCATHTHSGPEVFTRSKVPSENRLPAAQIDQAYLQMLVHKMADAVLMAHRDMREVKIGVALGELPEVHFNRRPTTEDGQAKMMFTLPAEIAATRKTERSPEGEVRVTFTFPPEEPPLRFGPVDPAVLTMRMEDANGKVIGSVVGFGCHPVCIYPHLSTTVSADYPAFATRVVEQVEGGTSLFLLGLAGNTVPLQRGVKPCEQIGQALGGEALSRLSLIATSDDVALKALSKEVVFPAKGTLDRITTEIQVLRLGDVHMLGLPGEVFVEVGLQIKKRANLPKLFIVTLANDAIGYVCHSRAYEEGGYEPQSATHLAKGAGEIMVEQALALLDEIKQVDRGKE